MKATIKFECPGCGQPMDGDAELEFQKVTCPTCANEFFPKPQQIVAPGKTPPRPNIQPAQSTPPTSAFRQPTEIEKIELRRQKIRRQASSFTFVAILFVIIGLVLEILCILDPNSSGGSSYSIAGCFGAALWFYLVAQIIHIRANTEK
jgi:hypothetical protein